MKTSALLFSILPLGLTVQGTRNMTDAGVIPFQIIISEIMADPDPVIRLPDAEYIELYNRGNNAVNLKDWKLMFGSHAVLLPETEMAPGGYLIITEQGIGDDLQSYGRTVLLSNMPAIVNNGQTLTLKAPSGTVIHTVTFAPDWFGTKEKAEGGRSIEIIDPDNVCGCSENWSASVDPQGGTPGIKNSVYKDNPDISAPYVLRAFCQSDSTVLLLFNEAMDSASINSPSFYSTNNGFLHPSYVYPVGPDYGAVLLIYHKCFKPSVRYTVSALSGLEDCSGNALSGKLSAEFTLPDHTEPSDVIINEVLSNPFPGNAEFIELFNRSAKVIDLADLTMIRVNTFTGDPDYNISMKKRTFLMFPGDYAVITSSAKNLPNDCYQKHPSAISELTDMFSMPNEEGIIAIINSVSQTIDEFHYDLAMHSEFLKEVTGISLERINPDKPADLVANWHSASSNCGYNTPGERNSQSDTGSDSGIEVSLGPEIFSPDNDGVDDYMTLQISLPASGWISTITIYNSAGRKVRDLAIHCLMGTRETFTWDGISDDNRLSDPGIYIVYMELFDDKGDVKKIKKVINLAKRF